MPFLKYIVRENSSRLKPILQIYKTAEVCCAYGVDDQGYACQDRLNFPGRFYNDIPIDVHKAVASISEDLVSTGESPHTSASLAKDVVCNTLQMW